MIGNCLTAVKGNKVRIINPGLHNLDAGPDFSHARIQVGEIDWVGNVEIHVKASDWIRHGHDKNPVYDTVVLHVVGVNDAVINRTDGSEIMQVVITLPSDFYSLYASMVECMDASRCLDKLGSMPDLIKIDWIESLGVERLQEKAGRLRDLFETTGHDWEQALFITLGRALGFGLNGVPFELLAKSIPLKYIFHHADNPFQIEALLFGQAGMLDPGLNLPDEYYINLCREYSFLAKKYTLRPIRRDVWKYARTRPQNFPHRRIAQFASFLSTDFRLRDSLMSAKGDSEKLEKIFDREASRYWRSHFDFGKETTSRQSVSFTRKAIESLIINVAAPFYMAYGAITGSPDIAELGLDLLNDLPAEKNSKVTPWETAGIKAKSAFESQALLHLRTQYCEIGKCLECRFGRRVLSDGLGIKSSKNSVALKDG